MTQNKKCPICNKDLKYNLDKKRYDCIRCGYINDGKKLIEKESRPQNKKEYGVNRLYRNIIYCILKSNEKYARQIKDANIEGIFLELEQNINGIFSEYERQKEQSN